MAVSHSNSTALDALEAAWKRSDGIFDMLTGGALFERPVHLRHPFVFYLGHLPAFAWNQVARGVLDEPAFRPFFDDLFERGIDPLSDSLADRQSIAEWPPIEEILEYRDRVRVALRAGFETIGERASTSRDPLVENHRIYHVALEHEELMHHETLLYLVHELGLDSKVAPADAPSLVTGGALPQEGIEVPAGETTLGADFDKAPFVWDNELSATKVDVDRFTIDRYPVSIEAFREFVDADGYTHGALWTDADRDWLARGNRQHPHHWFERDGRWWQRTMFGEAELDDIGGWPVLVTYAEARAYARWRGARLATEAELHRAAFGTPEGPERSFAWGEDAPDARHGNFGFRHYDPVPSGSHPDGASAFGVEELVGNGWEWTASRFRPLPGFRPWIRTYKGYSTDFFDDRHYVLFGGSWVTDEGLLRRSFRNWFQPHYPHVFATFRCVEP